jgi:hypothetical protein
MPSMAASTAVSRKNSTSVDRPLYPNYRMFVCCSMIKRQKIKVVVLGMPRDNRLSRSAQIDPPSISVDNAANSNDS